MAAAMCWCIVMIWCCPRMSEVACDSEVHAFVAQAQAARLAAQQLALLSASQRSAALAAMAQAIRTHQNTILEANAQDMAVHGATLTEAQQDRLLLTPHRIEAMAKAVDEIAAQPDPLGVTLKTWARPNGLNISQVTVPLGVIGMIYESRPNVTADAAALCLRAGNACILRGGSESFLSCTAIHAALLEGLQQAGLPEACARHAVQMAPTTDRAYVGQMLAGYGLLDVIIPRGGKSLVARVQNESRVPVLAHLDGNNHVYIHASADQAMACAVTLNAKLRRTGICGAAETLLIDKAWPHAAALLQALHDKGCALRGCAEAQKIANFVTAATAEDWATEYLAPIMAVKLVDGVEVAMAHIAHYGSHHTDAIVAQDQAVAERFLAVVDSAIVLHNASTQFADGGEFGFGGEIGIATGKLHARGPVGAQHLTSYKYVVRGNGQVRPV